MARLHAALEQSSYGRVVAVRRDAALEIGFEMKAKTVFVGIVGACALAAALMTVPASAQAQALPAGLAAGLDQQPAAYSMTAAKERRLMIMQETMRQQQYGRGRGGYGPGYGRGYGPRPGYGYGPRPGYGPGPGYGYRRGYDRW